jgi:alkaline phosphatase D
MEAMDVATDLKPELHVFLGDNVYADTEDMDQMRLRYAELANAPEFQRLSAQASLIATWDDHDYGANDSGKSYPKKVESREVFLEFWKEPLDSPRRQHPGVYTSYLYPGTTRTLQVILLDTRTFRDDLLANDGSGKNDYMPDDDPELTMLGAEQWQWLAEQLAVPADLRLIGSSNQFGHEYNGYESWTNFPVEQQRFLDLIESTRASRIFFLSGDVHWGEISKRELAPGYALYDVTSSGINENWPDFEPNQFRIGDVVSEYNVGFMEIDWPASSLTVSLYDYTAARRSHVTVAFSEIAFD